MAVAYTRGVDIESSVLQQGSEIWRTRVGRGRFTKKTRYTAPYLCEGCPALHRGRFDLNVFSLRPTYAHTALSSCGEADKIKNDIHLETCPCDHDPTWNEHDRTATLPAHSWHFRDPFSQRPVATCTRRARPKLFASSWLINRTGNTVITPPPPPSASSVRKPY